MPRYINMKNEVLAIEVKEGVVYFVKAGAEVEIPEVTDKVKELVTKGYLSPIVESLPESEIKTETKEEAKAEAEVKEEAKAEAEVKEEAKAEAEVKEKPKTGTRRSGKKTSK